MEKMRCANSYDRSRHGAAAAAARINRDPLTSVGVMWNSGFVEFRAPMTRRTLARHALRLGYHWGTKVRRYNWHSAVRSPSGVWNAAPAEIEFPAF